MSAQSALVLRSGKLTQTVATYTTGVGSGIQSSSGSIYLTTASNGTTAIQFQNASAAGAVTFDTTNKRMKVGDASAPTARVHIVAGTAAAGTAPIKFDAGTLMVQPEAGAIEYDGTDFYYTLDSLVRYTLPASAGTLTGTTESGAFYRSMVGYNYNANATAVTQYLTTVGCSCIPAPQTLSTAAMGYGVCASAWNGSDQLVAVGSGVGRGSSNFQYGVGVGYQAWQTGTYCVLIGYRTGNVGDQGSVVMIGMDAARPANSDGVTIGRNANTGNTNISMVCAGYYVALNSNNSSGALNVGHLASFNSGQSSSSSPVCLGYRAGYSLGGQYGIAIGYSCIDDNASPPAGQLPQQYGFFAGSLVGSGGSLLYGRNCIWIGDRAAYNAVGSAWDQDILIGYYAGRYIGSGTYNVAIGSESMYGVSSANNPAGQVAIGYRTLYAVTTSTDCVCLGNQAGSTITTGSSSIFIGDRVAASGATVNTEIVIAGGAATAKGTNTALYGTTSTTDTYVRGNTAHLGNESTGAKYLYFETTDQATRPGLAFAGGSGEMQYSNGGGVWNTIANGNTAPSTHATTHKNGGGDEISTTTAAINSIPKADGSGDLAIDWVNADARIASVFVAGTDSIGNGTTTWPLPSCGSIQYGGAYPLMICPKAGTLRDMYVYCGAGPASTETLTTTVLVNGVASALAVTITGTANTGNDTSTTVTVAAGDKIGLEMVTSAGGAVTAPICAFNYVV